MEAWESCGDFFWRLPLHNSHCAAHHFNNGLCTGLVQAPGLPLAEDKLPDFEDRAEMLGVEVDLSRAAAGKISVENKPQRKTELAEAISSIIKEGSVVPAQAAVHFGVHAVRRHATFWKVGETCNGGRQRLGNRT